MHNILKLKDNRIVTVVSANCSATDISQSDAEMDTRVREAVQAAIHKAKICKKPIAGYDRIIQRAYIETADGKRQYLSL